MEIRVINLTKKKLAAMPVAERRLLLLLGRSFNEINALKRLIAVLIRKDDPPHRVVDHAESGQVLIFLRLLVGTLHEAWELFRVRLQTNSVLSSKYLPLLSSEASDALENLKKQFGKGSPITAIRNKIAFHHKDDAELAETAFQVLDENQPWDFYLAKTTGMSFFYASELVVMAGALGLASKADGEKAQFKELCKLTMTMSDEILQLFENLITEIIAKSIGKVQGRIVELDAASFSKLSVPFFIDFSS